MMIGLIACGKHKEESIPATVSGEVMTEAVTSQSVETSSEEIATEETETEEITAEETALEETAAEETSEAETTAKKPAGKETTAKKPASKETTAKKPSAKETTAKETSAKETTAGETSDEESSEIPEEFLGTDEETVEEIPHEDHPMIPGARYEFTWPSVIDSGEIWIGGKRLWLLELSGGDEWETVSCIEYGSRTVEMEGKMGDHYMSCYACVTGEDTFYALVQCPLGLYDNVCTRIWKITASTESVEYCGMIQGHIPSEDHWVSDDEIYMELWEDEPCTPHTYACYRMTAEGPVPIEGRTYTEDPVQKS